MGERPAPAGPQCDSGLRAPESLDADGWAYGVTACGFVARAPSGPYLRGESSQLRDALDEHYRTVHPARWREMEINRRISAD